MNNPTTTTPSNYAKALGEFQAHKDAFRIAIVAPVHIQPTDNWIGAMNDASKTATIIIVDDSDGKVKLPDHWEVFDYAKQKEAMGEELYKEFEMFHKSSSCKQFGLWLAWKRGFDPVIVVDSDCILPPDFVAKHLEHLCIQRADRWSNPLNGTGWYSRGFPYNYRGVDKWAHMGLWENELDLYGHDRALAMPNLPPKLPPSGPYTGETSAQYFPLSGMNVSYRNDAIPWMLFLPNFTYDEQMKWEPPAKGRLWKFTRHDDIWGGYIFQKACELDRRGLSYGDPMVFHETVVDPYEDERSEEAMIHFENEWHDFVDWFFSTLIVTEERPGFEAAWFWGEMAKLTDQLGPFKGLIPAFEFWSHAVRQAK
jgi:hypothetical protein